MIKGVTKALKRMSDANYRKPSERKDVCAACKHSEVYENGRQGKLRCHKLRAYVQSYGRCDHHEPSA